MKRVLAVIAAFCTVISLCSAAAASEQQQYVYSTAANSGVRHEVCTTLLGTGAGDYYTGSYAYDVLCSLNSDALLQALRELMTSTHTHETTYGDCRDLAVITDCQNGDGTTISLLYTSYTATWDDWINNNTDGWNREHVWPQSLGGFKTSGPGADLHHIRPTDQQVNSRRGNLKFGNVSGGSTVMAVIDAGLEGGTRSSTYFEPLDNVKGDIARIILYMYVRYGGDARYNCSSITNVFESVDVLLEWCALDPVDTWEMGRNEVVAAIQGNRNVFIDYPELAWLLFDRSIPSGMSTPSGAAATAVPVCAHTSAYTTGAYEPDCTTDGYSGDLYCSDCGKLISTGSAIRATGHTNENGDQFCDLCSTAVTCGHGKTSLIGAKAATCTTTGYTGDTCCSYCGETLSAGASIPVTDHIPTLINAADAGCTTDGYSGDTVCAECGEQLECGEVIPSAGEHTYGDWNVTQEASASADGSQERTCSLCGATQTQVIPALSVPATQPETTVPAQTDAVGSTSDTSDSMLLIFVIILAVCAAGVITWAGTRSKRHPAPVETDDEL